MEIIGIEIELVAINKKKRWLVHLYFASNITIVLPRTNTLQKKEHIVGEVPLYILSFSPQDKPVTDWLVELLGTNQLTVANHFTPEQQAAIAALHHLNQRNQMLVSMKKAAIFLLLTIMVVAAVATAPFWLPYFTAFIIPLVAILTVASVLVAIPLVILGGLGIKWLLNRDHYQFKNILAKLKQFILKTPEKNPVISSPSPSVVNDSTDDAHHPCATDVDKTNSISTDEKGTRISYSDFFVPPQKQDPNGFVAEKDKTSNTDNNVLQDVTWQQQTESDLDSSSKTTSPPQTLGLSITPEIQTNTQIVMPMAVASTPERSTSMVVLTLMGVNDALIKTIETPTEGNAKSITEQLTPPEAIQTHIIHMLTPQEKTSAHIVDMLTPTEAESDTSNHSSTVGGTYLNFSYQDNNENHIDVLVKVTDPHMPNQFKTPTRFPGWNLAPSSPRIIEIDENSNNRQNRVCRKLNF
jgi:hypothetical protein